MIHLHCARGHRTARPSRERYLEQPRCLALNGAGFCLADTWQDPATITKGDIVALFWRTRAVPAIVLSWSGNPDALAQLIDEDGTRHRPGLGSWFTPGQPHAGAEPPLSLDDAEAIRPALETRLKEYRKEQKASTRAARDTVPMKEPCIDGPDVRAGREVWDIPYKLFDEAEDANISRGLSVRLVHYPAFQRSMEELRRHNRTYYDVLVLNIHQGRGPADIQRLLGIGRSAAKMRVNRGRKRLRELMAADLSVTTPAGDHRVESPSRTGAA